MKPTRWSSRVARSLVLATGALDPAAAISLLATDLIDEAAFDKPPFTPQVLASFKGVREVRERPMAGAARLMPENRELVIEVNQDHPRGRRNFSIDHEVSHILLPTYSGQAIEDASTGMFPDWSEEELLCDIGASTLLLDPRWIKPLAIERGPSIQTLFDLSGTFDASLQATAWKLADLDLWPCAFVFWEPGYRKGEAPDRSQPLIPGFEIFGLPNPKYRVAHPYGSPSFGRFVPLNKSVEPTSLVAQCADGREVTWGSEDFDLGREIVRLYCENAYAPYKAGGVARPRVVSMLLAAAPSAPSPGPSATYCMELL